MIWAPKRLVFAALLLLTVFVLLRHTTSSVIASDIPDIIPEGSDGPSRSYPPPPSSKLKKSQDQNVVNDITSKPLRERLAYHFPYDLQGRFPGYIWQTWKVGPASSEFQDHLRPMEASWTEKHPHFVHEVITDQAAEPLIKYLFASVPEVAEAYAAMPLPVLKADFFRYLILLARGGIYTDIDTYALKGAVEWLPSRLDRSTVGLVVGIEADPDRSDWAQWYARRIQFCQWTIQAKAGHPVLRETVAAVTEKALSLKKAGMLRHGRVPSNISVMEFTGPAIWTDTIFSYFNDRNYFEFDSQYQNITVADFFNVQEHKKVGDVVVLPITSFSPGVGQMGAGDTDDPMAFVKHDFEGSWKPENERKNSS